MPPLVHSPAAEVAADMIMIHAAAVLALFALIAAFRWFDRARPPRDDRGV